ncbi:repressor LexA [Chromatiales bacterium (ex Bugula neritina AB1)]|nr:repressor LexA [Chromatiales bacterium (ex Bugula neritina AB1)]
MPAKKSKSSKKPLLTERQKEVLELVCDGIRIDGMPPTRAEISYTLGFSSANAAESHLRALERKGMIDILVGASRGIVILPAAAEHVEQCRILTTENEAVPLPVVGRVAAGEPILAISNVEDHHLIDPQLFDPPADYLLRVKGMSMCNIGILDGDLLAVHSTHEARNKQIVVARVDDEVTVKRFHKARNKVTLFPENDDFDPIEVDLKHQDFAIEGIYVGVLRYKTGKK